MPKVKADTAADLIRSLYPEGADVPAVGVSIIMNMGGNRQVTAQTFYPVGSNIEGVNALIDSIMAPIERQRAISELVDLEEEHLKISKTVAQFNEDYSRIEGEHAVAQARRSVELDEMRNAADAAVNAAMTEANKLKGEALDKRNEEFRAGEEEFRAAKRSGEYEPKGHRRANLDRIDAQVRKMEEQNTKAVDNLGSDFNKLISDKEAEIHNADAERDQHKQNLEISLKRHNDEAERLLGEIGKRKILIG